MFSVVTVVCLKELVSVIATIDETKKNKTPPIKDFQGNNREEKSLKRAHSLLQPT